MSCTIAPTIKTLDEPSTLFNQLRNRYGYQQAKDIYYHIHSDEFINTHGDWTTLDQPTDIKLNEQGEPKLDFLVNALRLEDVYESRFSLRKKQKNVKEETPQVALKSLQIETTLDKAIVKLGQDLKRLQNSNKNELNTPAIGELSKLIKALETEGELHPLLFQIEKDVAAFKAVFQQVEESNINLNIEAAAMIMDKIRFYNEILSQKDIPLTQGKELLQGQLLTIAASLKEYENNLVVSMLQEGNYDQSVLDQYLNKDGTLKPLKDISQFSLQVLDLSRLNQVVAQLVNKELEESAYTVNLEANYLLEEFENIYNELIKRDGNIDYEDFMEVYNMDYFDKDTGKKYKKGDLTGNYLSKFDYRAIKDFLKLKKLNSKKKAEWLRKNLMLANNKELENKLQENYEKDKKYAEETIKPFDEEKFNQWLLINDPSNAIKTYNKIKKGTATDEEVELFYNSGRLSPYIQTEFTPEWVNEKYTKLQRDELKWKFYQKLMELNSYSQSLIPPIRDIKGNRVPKNHILELSKTFDEQVAKDGLLNLVKNKGIQILGGTYLATQGAERYEEINPFTGKASYQIYFPKQGTLNTDEKSKNLYHIMITQVALALQYKRKTEVEALSNLLLDFQEQGIKFQRKGGKIEALGKESNTYKTIEFAVKEALYNAGSIKTLWESSKKQMTPQEKQLANKLEKDLAKLIKEYDEERINNPAIARKLMLKILDKQQQLGKIGKSISVDQVIDTLTQYTRALGLGFNFTSGIADVMYGAITNYIHHGAKGLAAYRESIQMQLGGKTKAGKILEKVSEFLEGKTNEAQYVSKTKGKQSFLSNRANSNVFYFVHQISGGINANATAVIMLSKIKVTTPDGKEISYLEGYDNDGNWIIEGMEDPLKTEEGQAKLINGINTEIRRIHGNYTKQVYLNRTSLGRAAMVFMRWAPNAIQNRFGTKTGSLTRNQLEEGRYTTFFMKDGSVRSKEDLLKNVAFLFGKNYSNLTDLEKNNLRTIRKEMITLLFLITLALVVHLAFDDEEDKEPFVAKYLINLSTRLLRDLTFFMSTDLLKTTSKMFPQVDLIRKFIDLFYTSIQYMFDSENMDEIKGGPYSGQSRLTRKVTSLLPILRGIQGNIDQGTQVYK